MLPHPLTNFEIQNHYQSKWIYYNRLYSANNLPHIKDRKCVLNLDEYISLGTHWIAFCVNSDNGRTSYDAPYFSSLGFEHIQKK